MREQSITDYFHNDYRDYAVYTILGRAIPSFVDGMKPVQRKIVAASLQYAKSLINVSALQGAMKHNFDYHHGETSGQQAIIAMAQDFNQGLPYLEDDGQFGFLYDRTAGAPRYLDTKISKWSKLILEQDIDLLRYKHSDGKQIEPVTFLPILPMMLINGTNGIAVGFSTSYANRHPLEVALIVKWILSGRTKTRRLPNNLVVTPYYNGFKGQWCWHNDKFESVGTFETYNESTLRVTSLPINWQIKQFISFLTQLLHDGVIDDFFDYSNDSNICIDIVMDKELVKQYSTDGGQVQFLKDFGLIYAMPKDNLTSIMPDNTWRKFDNAKDFIYDFVNYRLGVYTSRKQFLIDKLLNQIARTNDIIRFIDLISNATIDFRTMTERDIKDILDKHSIQHHVLSIRVSRLTKDARHDYEDTLKKLHGELKLVKSQSEKDMYLADVDAIIDAMIHDGITMEPMHNIDGSNIIRVDQL